jgi:two-component system, NarL family, capsular synthesis sensor histidine kinase RcsC
MSHEIRTPLNGILGHLELLARSHLEPAQQERLGRIRLSADALLGIISDILDFSRIEAGQLDIDQVPFELRPLIEQTALLYAPAAQRKGLRLYYNVDPGLAPGYVADAHRIRQVLNNLVSNAVKFTESGRIILRVRSAPAQGAESVRLRFEVIDSGIGMTDEQRQQIFQPFSQADASISRRFGGSGLGLALCQELSELMGGFIEVQSTLSVGSVFSFELPVSVDEFAQTPAPSPLARSRIALLSLAAEWRSEIEGLLSGWGAEVMVAALPSELDVDGLKQADALVIFGTGQAWSADEEDALLAGVRRVVKATMDGPLVPEWQGDAYLISCYSSPALLAALQEPEPDVELPADETPYEPAERSSAEHQGLVLLIDDNPVNRELIQQQLETLGYAVEAAEDGATALRMWQEGRYEIVLTDINMPHMDGYELTEQLRARGATVPILAVTATALTSEKQHCKQAGINDLLLKPLSLEDLGEAMSRHLVQRSPPMVPIKAKWAGKYPEKVCRIFVESGTRDLETILDAARIRDTDTLLARVHSLKGALLMLGEHEIAAQCVELEKWIGAEGVGAARAGVDQLEITMRDLLRRYAEYL